MDDPICSAFAPLIGLPCWHVTRGQGSVLSFEFGAPRLLVREPYVSTSSSARVRQLAERRIVRPVGEWNLLVFCCHWGIKSGEIHAEDESSYEQIDAAARAIEGQKLEAFMLDADSRRTTFAFDLGATLTAWPYEANDDEQWSLYLPSKRVLSYRADGLFRFGSGEEMPEPRHWQPVAQDVCIP